MKLEAETERWMVRALAILRIGQVVPALPVLVSSPLSDYRQPAVVLGLYGLYVGWAALLFSVALYRNAVGSAWVWTDVAIAVLCVLAVGLSERPGIGVTWQNWTIGPAMGAAILALLYQGRWAGTAVGAVLVAAHVLGLWPELGSGAGVNEVLGNAGAGLAFTVGAGLVGGRLRRSAWLADRSAEDALHEREARARIAERVRQYDLLHTNVLTTLTLVAGVGGELSAELKSRCARDVDFLRNMAASVIDASPRGLNAELAAMVRDQSALGLDIQYSTDSLPADLPAEVVAALTHAAREALNNVAKYAGTDRSWLVATGDEGAVHITVTDQGRGFDPTATSNGFGLSHAIHHRVTEVGGTVNIDSRPGQGTTVEISWHP
ncbi:sensor histidine kinase [Amycolatopsis sp. cg9]|uniref:sensor histidine kinase n=1 Tax=Amycolatopsis sp. cg9 TaxID=3238801 RepID=UPI00352423AD